MVDVDGGGDRVMLEQEDGVMCTVQNIGLVGYDSYPSRHPLRRVRDPIRRMHLEMNESVLTRRPSHDTTRTDSIDSTESAPSQGQFD